MVPSFDMNPDDNSKTLMTSVDRQHTLSVTNNMKKGSLKLHKVVKYNGQNPTNATVPNTNPVQTQNSILAGVYTFNIYSDEGLTELVKTIETVS